MSPNRLKLVQALVAATNSDWYRVRSATHVRTIVAETAKIRAGRFQPPYLLPSSAAEVESSHRRRPVQPLVRGPLDQCRWQPAVNECDARTLA